MRPLVEQRLREAALFAPLAAATRTRLAAGAVAQHLPRGALLWQRGEAPDRLALLLNGRLDVVRTTAAGERMILRVLGPGAVVGLSTIAGQPHTADLVAGEPTELVLLDGARLRQVLAAEPDAALRIIAHLGELLGQLSDEVEELRFAKLDERLWACVRRLGRGRRELRFTHEELGQQIGASRANVSRALKRLERRGLLRCGRGRLTLLDR